MKDEFRANIIDIHVENVNNDPFGQVQSAYIALGGRWRSVDWEERPMPLCDVWHDRRFILNRRRQIDRMSEEKLTAMSDRVFAG